MPNGETLTKQGSRVLDCLRENRTRHLTAEELSVLLKEKKDAVSTATIYRQLEKLTEKGYIRKFTSSPDEPACYQYLSPDDECTHHFHLKCTSCGRLFHVSCPYIEELEKHVAEHHGFSVDNTRTVLYGVCRTCAGDDHAPSQEDQHIH